MFRNTPLACLVAALCLVLVPSMPSAADAQVIQTTQKILGRQLSCLQKGNRLIPGIMRKARFVRWRKVFKRRITKLTNLERIKKADKLRRKLKSKKFRRKLKKRCQTGTEQPDPTSSPTADPTSSPSATPTAAPTSSPTAIPTASPTATTTSVPTQTPIPPSCGDGICYDWENCHNCPIDCGSCDPSPTATPTTPPQPDTSIFVDLALAPANGDCAGDYDPTLRACGGGQFVAFDTIQEAVDASNPGDTIWIRGGTYNLAGLPPIRITSKIGRANAKITIRNYGSETVIIDAANVNQIWDGYHGIHVQYSEYVVLRGLTVRNSPGTGLRAYGSEYIEIKNCTFHSNGGPGIYTYLTSYLVVDSCEVYENANLGIGVTAIEATPSSYAEITNNLIYNQNVGDPESSDGISVGGWVYYTLVKGNIIFNNWDDGIDSSTGSMYSTIEDNIAFNSGDGPGDGDGNGIKVSTGNTFGSGGGHTVRNNIVFDNQGSGFDQCIEPNNPANWFYNNIAYGNDIYGFYLESDNGYEDEAAILYNNILAGNGTNMRDRFSISLNTSDYNLWDAAWTNDEEGEHSLVAEPEFNNPTLEVDTTFQAGWTLAQKMEYIRSQVREKFRLQAGSPAIDAGTIIDGYHCSTAGNHPDENCREWFGAAPDIGTYAYTGQ